MLLPIILALAIAQDSARSFNGAAKQTRVQIPRVDTSAVVDGMLNEPVWSRAARLTGFSQYQPVDGRPAEDPTEVLVWYGPDAIWFGIRAREVHGDVIRATRANRDNIGSEDHIQILLDTYNDHRNAFLFGVNALGVQQDGTRSDQFGGGAGGFSATGGGMRDMNPLDGNVDLNPDFAFESKGRLVDGGYEIEVRIPFKTLRYQDTGVQDWGLHVLRKVQHSGVQDSWAPALRANASFFAQAGTLAGFRDIHRGLVLDATPTATARADGSRSTLGQWGYTSATDFGADIHWGIRQNLTANATVNPDFSQVEADVGQVTLNERFALFYPEKRPFFLDGLELFDTPNQLVYTRKIVAPDGGLKLAGRLANTNVAAMVAADATKSSWSGGDHPLFGVARLRRDIGSNTSVGSVLTTREDGADFSRLAGADMRFYHSKLYWVEMQGVRSWSDSAGASRGGSMMNAVWDRTGRAYGFHYNVKATAPDFRAAAGFVSRTGTVDVIAANRVTFYGAPGDLVQQSGAFFNITRVADYRSPHLGFIEGSEGMSPSATLRGGWRVSSSVSRAFVSYNPAQYGAYTVQKTVLVPFTVPAPERNLFAGSLSVTTPTFRYFTATASVGRSQTPIFREAAVGHGTRYDATVDLRPTGGLRTSLQMTQLLLDRSRDGSSFSREIIPRVKVEYQVARPMFVRVISQYNKRTRSPLVDRSGSPILVSGTLDAGERFGELQTDWLFSYRPSPGTLFYFGYGQTMDEAIPYRWRDLQRTRNGFFAKGSYLFRM